MDETHASMTQPGTEPASTPYGTRVALLKRQARGYTAVRGVLVQLPEPDVDGNRASVLARIVHEGKHRALLLYLLLLGAAPTLAELEEPVQADVWVRALTGPGPAIPRDPAASKPLTWTRSTLSRAWGDLIRLGLVERRRVGRLVDVVPCREDGQGAPYDPPGGRTDLENAYFILPDEFWAADGLFAKLSLPALAMLLLFAKETNKSGEAYFTLAQIEQWYGIKRRTAQNGIKQLVALGILGQRREVVAAPLSKTGTTVRTWYDLTGDYGHLARKAMRTAAKAERSARLAKTPTTTKTNPAPPPETPKRINTGTRQQVATGKDS